MFASVSSSRLIASHCPCGPKPRPPNGSVCCQGSGPPPLLKCWPDGRPAPWAIHRKVVSKFVGIHLCYGVSQGVEQFLGPYTVQCVPSVLTSTTDCLSAFLSTMALTSRTPSVSLTVSVSNSARVSARVSTSNYDECTLPSVTPSVCNEVCLSFHLC